MAIGGRVVVGMAAVGGAGAAVEGKPMAVEMVLVCDHNYYYNIIKKLYNFLSGVRFFFFFFRGC